MGQSLGLVGVGVMGGSLALNFESHGVPVALYDRKPEKTEAFVQTRGKGTRMIAARSLGELAASLERPRCVLLMVTAGPAVDAVLEQLSPHLEAGDIVVDGGNSNHADTDRRIEALAPSGIRFVGMGVSGGEEGALRGPSLMPGGDRSAWERLEPMLVKIAANADTGPCVTWVGAKSAGHYVKMVHNGIEYGDMQLIAEAYDLLRHGLGLTPAEISEIFAEWNEGELESFLVEITSKIVAFKDDQGGRKPLLDAIEDAAGQKGTGRWTVQSAVELGVAVPTLAAAVDARVVSSQRELRGRLSSVYRPGVRPSKTPRKRAIERIRAALYASKICAYAQGFDLLRHADAEHGYGLDLSEIARIWKAGCIIRARFLDDVRAAYRADPAQPNLLLDASFVREVKKRVEDWRATVTLSVGLGATCPAMSASLAYFDSLRRARLPANLIQAQRDYFGAHTYRRLDRECSFHTEWDE